MGIVEPFLVADIGGTNARFGLAQAIDGKVIVDQVRKFRAEDFNSIHDAAAAYIDSIAQRPQAACVAVAAPVTDEQAEFTNSPWALNIDQFKSDFALKRFRVVNDFEALATGVLCIPEEEFLPVKPGAGDPNAPVVVVGPGTGLGQALIVPFGGRARVVPTEGGHVAFAPRSDEEIALMHFILRDHSRVSVERILSGMGIVNLYKVLCEIEGVSCPTLQANEITAAATSAEDPIAVGAVNIFCALLGRVAGDAVLGTGSRGGVVLGGGILPKIRELFLKSAFIECFLDKGRMRYYVEDVPVRLIISDGAALLGAALMAKESGNAH